MFAIALQIGRALVVFSLLTFIIFKAYSKFLTFIVNPKPTKLNTYINHILVLIVFWSVCTFTKIIICYLTKLFPNFFRFSTIFEKYQKIANTSNFNYFMPNPTPAYGGWLFVYSQLGLLQFSHMLGWKIISPHYFNQPLQICNCVLEKAVLTIYKCELAFQGNSVSMSCILHCTGIVALLNEKIQQYHPFSIEYPFH